MKNGLNIAAAAVFVIVMAAGILGGQKKVVQPPKERRIALSTPLPQDVSAILLPAWDKAYKVCPGLEEFHDDLKFDGTEDNRSYAPPEAQALTVVVKVSDDPALIPGRLRAAGHRCFFEFSPDGKELRISKTPCASLCLARDAEREMTLRTRMLKLKIGS